MRTGVTVGALALAAAMVGPAVAYTTAHAHAISASAQPSGTPAPAKAGTGETASTAGAGGERTSGTAKSGAATSGTATSGTAKSRAATPGAGEADTRTYGLARASTGVASVGRAETGAAKTRAGTKAGTGMAGAGTNDTGRAGTPKSGTGRSGGGDPTPPPVAEPDPLTQGTVINTVSYGPHVRQRMDVWYQTDELKRPGVFLIHGGWWSSGDKKYMTEISRSYAEQGYVVFNINYRLSTDASWPAQRTDTLDAIATARRHAALWSFDPSNYVIVGFSAGGHLAGAAGTYKSGLPGLRGVVGISPVISPLTAYTEGTDTFDLEKRKLRESAIRLAGGCEPTGKCARVWASMEVPWHASRGDAPMLVVHSEDEFVSAEHGKQLKEHLRQVGVPVTIVSEPGIEHSAPLYRLPGVAERVQEWVAEKLLSPGR
ncbi:alpha/beta hydrolase fold domain-containing protein [Streptosporangium sp. NPDC002524]|uniref:alpha/beta hydrolase fold domain-containing protein n=1 Tax=Streptosporangium sp. NPDC002524 TaxID=3154537 RepID=UPI003333C830